MDGSSEAERGGSAMSVSQNNPRKSLSICRCVFVFPGPSRADVMRSPPWLPIQMWPRPWQLRLAWLQMCFLKGEGRRENRLRGNPNITGGQAEPEPLHLLFLGSSSRIWFVFPSLPSVSFLRESAAYVDPPGHGEQVFPRPCSRPAAVLWRGPRPCFGAERAAGSAAATLQTGSPP